MDRLKEIFHKYLVPHPGNDHRPHLLRTECALALALVLIFSQAALFGQLALITERPGFLASILPSVLVDITNEERAENSAPPVATNPLLVAAATMKAEDMAAKGYFAHKTPEGYEPWHWLEKAGYEYQDAGENLAVDFFDSADVATAWMNSPTHRANVVNGKYTEIGIAMAQGTYQGHSTIFVVEFFGRPKKARAATPAAPVAAQPPLAAASVSPVPSPAPKPARSEVLAAETVSAPDPASSANLIPDFLGRVLASPHLFNTYILGAVLAAVLFALLVLAFRKSSHKILYLNGAGLAAAAVFLLLVNAGLFSGVKLPAGSQAASISEAF